MTISSCLSRCGSTSRRAFMARSRAAAVSLAAVSLAAVSLAAVSLIACSSSDDVVASIDEPSSAALPSAQSGGAPLLTIVQSDLAPAAGAPAPAGTALPPPLAGSASAGIGRPPPPDAWAAGEALFVSGTPQSPPVAGAEPWPLDEPLRQFFLQAPEQRLVVMVVKGPALEPLRELAARHGLGVAASRVRVLVEDEVGDQFELVLSDDPPLAGAPLPADE
jgi:hypothetical protein